MFTVMKTNLCAGNVKKTSTQKVRSSPISEFQPPYESVNINVRLVLLDGHHQSNGLDMLQNRQLSEISS